MSAKQPIFTYKQGTNPIYIRPVNAEGADLDLGVAVTDALFTLKTSSLDSIALIKYQLTIDTSNLEKEGTVELKITFTAPHLALLVPGDFVAEIQIEVSTQWKISDTFIFRVVPQIGVPT